MLKIRKDDDLLFSLRNDVLGYIDKMETDFNESNNNELFKAPTKCTCCGMKLKIDDNYLFCDNKEKLITKHKRTVKLKMIQNL